MKCKIYNIFPKFLRFKLYKRCLQKTNFYKPWQAKLLICETNSKRTAISKLTDQMSDCRSKLKITFSHIIFCVIIRYVDKKLLSFRSTTLQTHNRKLNLLGVNNEIKPCDPNSVILNYSSLSLPTRLKVLLAYSLDFCLPLYHLSFYKCFLCFEKMFFCVQNDSNSCNFSEFTNHLQSVAFKHFHGFKPFKIFSAVF